MSADCLTCTKSYWTHPHCRDCHLDWTSLVQAHCTVSCRQFAGDSGFKDHITSHGEHVDPGTKSKVYALDPKGVWRRTDGAPRVYPTEAVSDPSGVLQEATNDRERVLVA